MSDIKLYGFPVSPNVRAARKAFHEKAVAIEFREIGLDHLPSSEYGAINPFRKMPALVHGGVTLYETPALMTYADGIGSGPSLEPADAAPRAKMWQFAGVAQNYLYPVGCMTSRLPAAHLATFRTPSVSRRHGAGAARRTRPESGPRVELRSTQAIATSVIRSSNGRGSFDHFATKACICP